MNHHCLRHWKHSLKPILIIICGWLLSVSLVQASESCDKSIIATIDSELKGLTSISQSFERLAQANLEKDFSLSFLFTIDLLNERAVATRLSELKSQTSSPYDCEQDNIVEKLAKRKQLLQSVNAKRVQYLSLSSEERQYLNSLIKIHNRLQNDMEAWNNNIQQAEKDINTLNQQLAQFEREFKAQQEPEARTALFENISATNERLQLLASTADADNTKLEAIKPLQAFTKALLVDYHRFYKLENNKARSHQAQPLFSHLTAPRQLSELIQVSASNGLIDHEYQTVLAALIIIHGRLYLQPRQQEAVAEVLIKPYKQLIDDLRHEIQTLVALPVANLHFKLQPQNTEHQYLSRTLFQSATNLAIQLIAVLMFWVFLKRVPLWVNSWQQHLVRNHLSKRHVRQLIALLRLLQPNAAWLFAILFYYYLDAVSEETLRDWVILYDVTAIIAFYLLINTLATWAINNTNSQAHLFVLRSKQLNIAHHCHRFAFYITLSAVLYIILNSLLRGGIICTIYFAVLLVIIWLFSYRLITHFQQELITHLSKRVSEQNLNNFTRLQRPIIKIFVNPVIFIGLQFYDLVIASHNWLLRIEGYQTLTAKFLKIRLEQSQAIADSQEKETQDDTHYESWFLKKELIEAKPNLLMKSPWINDITQRVEEWLEGKYEENDLALVGDNGVGKSTLLKQFLDSWDKSKQAYIKIPSKTTRGDEVFRLVCDALQLENIEDIAQFVVQQQEMEPTIIVIDEAHHLFLSDVGGFEAYKMLQSLISAKLDNIFWMIAINRQSWIYLNDVFSRTYQFSATIELSRWNQQDIRELILRRHRASRRQLSYDELLLASTSHSETANRAAEARCFSLLWDQSSGIPSVALAIWINASRNPSKGKIEMGIPERPTSSVMLNLSDDHLFVYAALVTHESLNTQQAQAVTHLSEAIVRRALKLGLDQGFVVRKSHGRYIINPLWQLQLFQLLRRKNFLHE
ncbi:MAG: AAA family ATPase [Pseudomonadales bacterium]|nr:AAA family ATPase [Pseudomonadales bacterium]